MFASVASIGFGLFEASGIVVSRCHFVCIIVLLEIRPFWRSGER